MPDEIVTPAPDPNPGEDKIPVGAPLPDSPAIAPQTITVDGQDQQVTLDELKADAQRWRSGDNKAAEAKALRDSLADDLADAKVGKLARQAVALDQDVSATPEQKLQATQELMRAAGYAQEYVTNYVNEYKQSLQAPVQGQEGERTNAVGTQNDALAAENAALRERADAQEQRLADIEAGYFPQQQSRAREEVNAMVENDPVLGKIVSKAGPRSDRVKEIVWEEALQGAQDAKARKLGNGPEVLKNVLDKAMAKVRALVDDLDIRDRAIPSTGGLGLSPGSAPLSPEKPPERKSLTDKGYAESLMDSFQYELAMNPDDVG